MDKPLKSPPPPNSSRPRLSGIAIKVIATYAKWHNIAPKIPKMRRYSLGVRIDQIFAEIIELISTAQFSVKEERINAISRAILRNDVLKSMLYVLLELHGIYDKDFVAIAPDVEEIGRMLYGWKNQTIKDVTKQTVPTTPPVSGVKSDGNKKK